MTTLGPHVRKLICHRAAQLLIPPGGRLADLGAGLVLPARISNAAREAAEWAQAVIRAVKATPDNPWGDDDEAIAGEILRRLQQRATGT